MTWKAAEWEANTLLRSGAYGGIFLCSCEKFGELMCRLKHVKPSSFYKLIAAAEGLNKVVFPTPSRRH